MQRVILSESAGAIEFRVSKPGYAATSTNLDNFLVNEQFFQCVPLVILSIGSITCISVNGSTGVALCQYAYPHGLAFTPMVKSFTSFSAITGSFPGDAGHTILAPSYLVVGAGDQTGTLTWVGADASYIYLSIPAGYYSGSPPSVGSTWTLSSGPVLVGVFGVAV